MNQVCMGIDESGQHHASANIQLLCRPRFRQPLHLGSISGHCDSPVSNEQRAIPNQTEIRQRRPTPGPTAPQRQQLRSTSNEKGIDQGARIMPKPSREIR
jgi:hypothetical protein